MVRGILFGLLFQSLAVAFGTALVAVWHAYAKAYQRRVPHHAHHAAGKDFTIRMRGAELVIHHTVDGQLAVEHMPLVPTADVIQACAGRLPSLLKVLLTSA